MTTLTAYRPNRAALDALAEDEDAVREAWVRLAALAALRPTHPELIAVAQRIWKAWGRIERDRRSRERVLQ